MKKIGELFGISVYTTIEVEKDKIVIISPTKEVLEKIQALLIEKLRSQE